MNDAPDREMRFKTVLESNQDRIYRICCCYIRDEDERRDVFQNVLLQLWKNLRAFEGRSAISTWLYRITVNVCLSHLRVTKRRHLLFTEEIVTERSAALPDPSTSEASQQTERDVRHLYECIQRLPDLDKTLISLFLEDASTREMAEVVGISEANVRVKLHRIKKSLKQLWEKTEHECE